MPFRRRANFFLILLVIGIFVLSVALIMLMTRPAWPASPATQQSCTGARITAPIFPKR